MEESWQNRVVVITGGTAGIGRSCAEYLSSLGASVCVIGRKQVTDFPSTIDVFTADVTSSESLVQVMKSVHERHGAIDVLVNNAGVSFVGDVETGTIDQWTELWDVNVLGYVRATRAALPYLRESTAPTIVNMSSITASTGFRDRALYSATKGAIEALTRAQAADLVSEGITVNAVRPGTVDTPFMEDLAARAADPLARRREYENRQPTGRMVSPDEVSLAVTYLAHPMNRSTVGTVVTIDGGISGLHITDA